jgi:serine/threonine protein kinase
MAPAHLAAGSNQGNWDSREQLLFEFEQAWQREPPPALEVFWRTACPSDSSQRRELLEELVKIDLEWRWRRPPSPGGSSVRPRLEEYAARYPDLGGMSLALIGEEYRVRQRWGDWPGHEEYLLRFPSHAPQLRLLLSRYDTQIASEFSSQKAPKPLPQRGLALVGGAAPVPSPVTTAAALLDSLREHQICTPAQLNELTRGRAARFTASRDLAKELLRRGWLTPFQVNQLLQGRGRELVLGPYLFLERLGEGGIGQVFKARHQRMNRIVALKILRKELVADPEVMSRFHREIQVIGQLDHPNIVHAYDAGPIGSAHVLAMEYVEGIDLARLVGQQGPVSAHRACDWICQAAAGLQYAHERGLVHRDLKPSNLMVCSRLVSGKEPLPGATPHSSLTTQQIKVLDMGLARFRPGATKEAATRPAEDRSNTLTPPDAVVMMGTADYMAPEQAFDFHGADIRADVYSLGCTLFFLLTGQSPFSGGTLAEKLTRHQRSEPPPVRKVRPELPTELDPVLQKMLAKDPKDRHQTPGELAESLARLIGQLGTPVAVPVVGTPTARAAAPLARILRRTSWRTRLRRTVPRRLRRGLSRRWQLIGGAGMALVAAMVMIFWLGSGRSQPLGWVILEPVQLTSEGGATLTKLPDRSILASGKLAPADTYTITAFTDLQDITAVRLELLPHSSLPSQGPGRHVASGNPVLSEFHLLAAPRKNPSKTEPIALVNPTAEMNQDGWPVTSAVDGRLETGWAISPKFGERHAAVFETKKPYSFSGGTLLIFVLDQKYPEAPIGRFRLAVTRNPLPIRATDKLPEVER